MGHKSLDMICDPSVGEEQAAKFETILTTVRYIRSAAQLKKEYFDVLVTTQSYPKSFAI